MASVTRALRRSSSAATISGGAVPALATSQACFRNFPIALRRGPRPLTAAPPTRALNIHGIRNFSVTRNWRSAELPEEKRGGSKLWASADEAVADIESGSVLLSAGFGL